MVFANDLKNATERDMELLRDYFRGFDYRGASYTFIAHYIWKNSFCMSWEIIDGYLCLAGTKCGKEDGIAFMAMPLVMNKDAAEKWSGEEIPRPTNASDSSEGNSGAAEGIAGFTPRTEYDPKSLRSVIIECENRFSEAGRPLMFSSIPGHMLDILREAFPGDGRIIPKTDFVEDEMPSLADASGTTEIQFIHERDYDEYVYLKEKLITLSGRALHKKKNHLNFFLRNFEYEARSIREVDRKDILALAAEIRDYKAQDEEEEEDIENEYSAIEELLNIMERNSEDESLARNPFDANPCAGGCPIYGVGIYINNKLEAFAIGEVISDSLAAEHFEKANDDFRGLYQLVCSEFCKALPESIEYVNREEDMGIPGLRQAKEALKPDHMEERFTAIATFPL